MRGKFHDMIAAGQRGEYALRDRIHEEIFRSMYRLVMKIAHKTFDRHRDCCYYYDASIAKDDYEQEGCLALCKAMDGFNPDNGTCLSTYATTVIKRHLNEFASIRKKRECEVREIRNPEDVYGENWEERIDDGFADAGKSVEMAEDEIAVLWDGVDRLSQKERDCLFSTCKLNEDGPRAADIAVKYGISRPRVSQIKDDAANKLRKHLAVELGMA